MQKPLVDNDLIEVIDTAQLPNWAKDKNIGEFLGKGKPGFNFIGYQDKVYGCPSVLQGDSFAYLPEKTGQLDSYAALFDPKWKGYVALEDNYTTAGQKTALYLKKANLAEIGNPDDMTADEFKTVVDFLIDQKKKGQFRVIWSSFQQAVDLIVNKEVYVIDCWEPMVFVAKSKGVDAVYADPEGRLSPLGDGGVSDQEPEPHRRADEGRLPASRLHAGRLVRRQDHRAPRVHDQHRRAGLRQGPRRRVPGSGEPRRSPTSPPMSAGSSRKAAPGRTAGRLRSTSTKPNGRASRRHERKRAGSAARFARPPGVSLPAHRFPGGFPSRTARTDDRGELLGAGRTLRPARFRFNSYFAFFDGVRLLVLERSLLVSFEATALSLLVAYPIAYFLAFKARPAATRLVLLLFTVPFLVNHIIRTFAWTYLLGRTGPINGLLMASGVTDAPLDWLLYSDFAVLVGMITSYMPFMIFPMWMSLAGIDRPCRGELGARRDPPAGHSSGSRCRCRCQAFSPRRFSASSAVSARARSRSSWAASAIS